MAKFRQIPNVEAFGPMQHRVGVKLSLASTAFLHRYGKCLEDVNLTPSRVLALACIFSLPGLDQKTFSENLAINEASAMSVINRLELCGFVERRPGRDKRTKALYLTREGKDVFLKALEIEEQLSIDIFDWMSDEERISFVSCIDKILARSSL